MRLVAALSLLLAGCGRYADFTLPDLDGRQPVQYRWEARPDPVLRRGAAGSWDAVDVLNPAVFRFGGQLYNLYSGFDGALWHTGLATSTDGITWTKHGRVLTAAPGSYIAANGAALVIDREVFYWYPAGATPRIELARSADGRRYTPAGTAVPTGPRGSWDECGVADPYVVEVRGVYYLFYLGQDRARRQRLGVARSVNGLIWEKLRTNPILELGGLDSFDENGLGEPAVWSAHGWYWMLYTGRDRAKVRRLGLARSADGVRWEKLPPVFAGDRAWNAKVLCDPSVLAEGGRLRVWFGGGDTPHPAENIHGEIGAAELVTLTE